MLTQAHNEEIKSPRQHIVIRYRQHSGLVANKPNSLFSSANLRAKDVNFLHHNYYVEKHLRHLTSQAPIQVQQL